ncbi:hypothetical protein V2A60_000397 [Cordyceps javanica]
MRVRHTQSNGAATHDAQEWVREKLARMTLEEKVLLLTGKDMWCTNSIERLGIPESRLRVDLSEISLAATWGLELLQRLCGIIVTEAKSKEVDVILGPSVCIPRTPLGGRNFEAYSEGFFLTGKFASTFITDIQACGIGSCTKHFAATDQETRCFFFDARIPDRALREIHLQPFQIAFRDSSP